MRYLLEDAYPRRWLKCNHSSSYNRKHDWSSLEALVVYHSPTSNDLGRSTVLREHVLYHLPLNVEFNTAMVLGRMQDRIGMHYDSVQQCINVLIREGYPLERVRNGWYLYTPRRGGEV